MTNSKRKVLVISLVISIIAILSMGTLAWFQDQDSVTNDFMFADSNEDPDDIFSIDIYEEYDEDGDGTDERYDDGIEYTGEDVIPGATLQKEAFVENTGKYDQYVRVAATISDIDVWFDVFGIDPTQLGNTGVDLADYFVVANDFNDKWYRYGSSYNAQDNSYTFVYYYNGILAPDETVPFIEAFKIPGELTLDHVAAMDGSFSIDLKAQAIQADHILDTLSANEYENAIAAFAYYTED